MLQTNDDHLIVIYIAEQDKKTSVITDIIQEQALDENNHQ